MQIGKYFNNITFKKAMVLLAIGLIVLISLRLVQLITSNPNLLINSGFEQSKLTGWQSEGNGTAASTPSIANNQNNVLLLAIPAATEGSWIGVGQRNTINPQQQYKVSINYQLVNSENSSSKIIIRISQFDQNGNIVKSEEISTPEPLTGNVWQSLSHNFSTDDIATIVEIGVGLVGNQETSVEFDDFILTPSSWFESAKRDLGIVIPLCLLILVTIGYIFWPTIKQHRRLATIVIVNIILFIILSELFALGIYFVRDGKIFYTNKTEYEPIQEIQGQELTQKRIHPYFGHVEKTGKEWKNDSIDLTNLAVETRTSNNHGFYSSFDYPFVKSNKDQYIIGIFGGSVARDIAILGQNALIKKLQQAKFFTDKEIVVLNFSNGGYKQPQQLLTLTYFLSIGQEFDMVINIDGFNEVFSSKLNNKNNLDISMPDTVRDFADLTNQTTLNYEKVESIAKINQYKEKLDDIANTINKTPFASGSFILEVYYAYLLNQYKEETIRFQNIESTGLDTSIVFAKPVEQQLTDPELYRFVAEVWANASLMMNQTLIQRKIPYIHILQPNQYYSNKVFSVDEAKIAFNVNNSRKPAIEQGYPLLEEKSEELLQNGVNFYNAVQIFDNVSTSIYRDDCCHYNQQGNQIFAEFIADAILNSDISGNEQ